MAFVAAVSLNAQPVTWVCDPSHSNMLFTVDHLVVSEVQGYFKIFDGKMTASKADLSDAQIEFNIDVASINTDNNQRDNHLKSDDFFNAEKFPKMTFKSKSMKKVGDKKYKLTGILTIRDISKEITFDVSYGGEIKDPWGNVKSGFKAETTINRFDYNLKWNTLTEMGGAVVGKEVRIRCNIELKKS